MLSTNNCDLRSSDTTKVVTSLKSIIQELLPVLKERVQKTVSETQYPPTAIDNTMINDGRPYTLMGLPQDEVLHCPNCEFATKHLQDLLKDRNVKTDRQIGKCLDNDLVPFPYNRYLGCSPHIILVFTTNNSAAERIIIDPTYRQFLLMHFPKESRTELFRQLPQEVLIVRESRLFNELEHMATKWKDLGGNRQYQSNGIVADRESFLNDLKKAYDLTLYTKYIDPKQQTNRLPSNLS